MEPNLILPASAPSAITLSIANKNGDLATNFRRLVFEQYQMRGWLDPNEYPEGIVTDKYDDHSDLLVVQSGEEVVAGMRIVRDMGFGYPHEKDLPITQFIPSGYYENKTLRKLANTDRKNMAEITKVVGKKQQRMLTFDIIKCLYWYAKRSDIELYLMVVDLDFYKLCTRLGIPIEPIGNEVYCEGSLTLPAVTDPSCYAESISKKSKRNWEYIATQHNLDDTWTRRH